MRTHTSDRLPLARLPSGLRVETTVHVYGRGAARVGDADADADPDAPLAGVDADALAEGPTLYVQAAQHGREINGPEVCRRLHDRLVGLPDDAWRGTLVVVPVADPLTFDRVSYTTPEALDSVHANMNRAWPGEADGSAHQRMAARLWPHATAADACVDLHTGSPEMVTHTVYLRGHGAARALAEAFGVPLIFGEAAGDDADDEWHARGFAGKFRVAATRAGVPTITPELAHNKELVEPAIEAGVRGVVGAARHVGALSPDADVPFPAADAGAGAGAGAAGDGPAADAPRAADADGSAPDPDPDPDPDPVPGVPAGEFRYARNHLGRVRAAEAGLYVVADGVRLGVEVEAGDVVGRVYDPTTYEELQTATVDRPGYVYSIAREATVTGGQALVGVAEPLPADER
jgi:predicted deacylase